MPSGQRAAVRRRRGNERRCMLTNALDDTGLRGWRAHTASLASIGSCVTADVRGRITLGPCAGGSRRVAV
jgi:hypothetical protein